MRELLRCLKDWLDAHRANGNAYLLVVALVSETLKRVDSSDPGQREFDAEAWAPAAGGPDEFEAAKRWIDNARPERFGKARQAAIEAHFRAAGYQQALQLIRRSSAGKHRTVWFMEAYPLPDPATELEQCEQKEEPSEQEPSAAIEYEFTPPGKVRPSWYARPMIGAGSFVTRSWRGVFWAVAFLVPIAYLSFSVLVGVAFTTERRALQTADLASMIALLGLGWTVWRGVIRPTLWLVDDRMILAGALWTDWKETTAQLELAKDADDRRRLQLVRYSSVCPICAGTVELRYSEGPNRRRLVGCCNEAPHDHVFSFDRVSRRGLRLHAY